MTTPTTTVAERRAPVPKKLEKLDLETERKKSVQLKGDHVVVEDKAKTKKTGKTKTGKAKSSPTKVAVGDFDSLHDQKAASAIVTTPDERPRDSEKSPPKKEAKKKRNADKSRGSGAPVMAANATSAAVEGQPPREGEQQLAKGIYDVFIHTRRCERLCYELGLTLADIRVMKKKYDENDMYHTGEITQAEFFFILNETRRPLTKGILQFGNVSPEQKFMSFDEYVLCTVTFASMTAPEVYQFIFDLYDEDKSGSLDEREFTQMSKELQSQQFCFPKNVETAIKMIEGKDGRHMTQDGLVDLDEFMKFARLFPVAFFPLFNFQKNVRRVTLGQSKWSNIVARKLKIQELVSHMRRNYGAIPDLTLWQRLWSVIDGEELFIRKRAGEVYGQELNQRRLIGDHEDQPMDQLEDAR